MMLILKMKNIQKKLQEYYASECANIAKTYPNATGFAINNFEKNKLLNKRDGLGRCVSLILELYRPPTSHPDLN